MEYIWAPWRSAYVADTSKKTKKDSSCIFCDFIKQDNDKENLIVYRGRYAFVILNRFPYNPGHLMIVPYRHVSTLELLEDHEISEIFKLSKISMKVIRSIYSPDGFNLGVNIGRVAGAGIESHVHVHIVPRWNGDANFMPIIANTKVLPESLGDTYKKIKDGIQKILDEDTFDH
ncbi:HIT domain-containing protein [Acidianus sulfidivorans JP7]|uniref:HIT family hydrolase n=1 Tax=Acidianus sulfidivorans JP7 TaxID=619593 RepID=A0A2U9IMH8_9CREN|nr:HIT domain-containing protein [Acidianus sulfidivorans]AWR97220.1 HIT domain-containing protein [Acidianus sulfidivorans JP7]